MTGINEAKSGEVIAHAQGLQGELFLFEERIRISRKGTGVYYSYGLTRDIDIPLRDISSIQFKPTGTFSNGYIQFAFKGGTSTKEALEEAQDKTMMVFTKQQEYEFEQLRDKLQLMLRARTTQSDAS